MIYDRSGPEKVFHKYMDEIDSEQNESLNILALAHGVDLFLSAGEKVLEAKYTGKSMSPYC